VTKDTVRVLAINGGSSSIKFALYHARGVPTRVMHGKIDRVGVRGTTMTFDDDTRSQQDSRVIGDLDHGLAVTFLIDWLDEHMNLASLAAVGHRVVTGGARYFEPQRVTEEVLEALRSISAYAPDHLPSEMAVIERLRERMPGLLQVVCFDTAFHQDLPRVAKMLAIPRRLQAKGVERYGFHGLSYSYLMEELGRLVSSEAAHGRVILAHIGNGVSLAAVRGGQCIDTSMGFSPAAGVPMATRSGDLDPGLLWYLAQTEQMTAAQFQQMVNHESGLLGISETSADVRDLLSREADDVRAAEAISLFCYQIRKCIGAFAAALGGLDTLIFAGGIGENAPVIRTRICDDLGFLGLQLDTDRNANNEALVSADASPVAVRVIPTDEALMIVKATSRILA
jgi:acetate kinase